MAVTGSASAGDQRAPATDDPHTTSERTTAARRVANEAVPKIAVPAAWVSALVLGLVGVLFSNWVLLGIAGLALGIAILSRLQNPNAENRSAQILLLVSTAFGILAPFASGGLAVSIVPVLVILAFLGIFDTSRRVTIAVAVWCLVLIVWSMAWTFPDLAPIEFVVITVVLGGTAIGAFAVFVMAENARRKQEETFWMLFEGSPIATWELDFSGVVRWLSGLETQGAAELREFLHNDPGQVVRGVSQIRILNSNTATIEMFRHVPLAPVVVDHLSSGGVEEITPFIEMLIAVQQKQQSLGLDVTGLRVADHRLDAVLHWSVAPTPSGPDFSRVIVTLSDITPRREAEERLQVALASNELLVSYERAIATCSRALLMATGEEEGSNKALDTLRRAIGADVAYLVRNVEDSSEPTMEVVTAAHDDRPSVADEIGKMYPWSNWPDVLEKMRQGESQVVTLEAEDSTTVKRLAVPVFSAGRWMGVFRFDTRGDGDLPQEAMNLIEVAAPMFGAQWERELSRLRLEELVESKDQFLASVSHELRTPLSAVVGFAEFLRDEGQEVDSEEQEEMLETIASQSQDMSNMVEDLLVAARADIGTVTIHPGEVYLRAQVEVALAGLTLDGEIAVEVKGDHGRSWADPSRTRQIVRNLLTNAIRYGGDTVAVECITGDEVTRLEVRDSGPGLPESEWEQIFEPYQRAHDRPTQTASIGLGLTVSRQLARLMDGDLVYRTGATGGSVFELSLPAVREEALLPAPTG